MSIKEIRLLVKQLPHFYIGHCFNYHWISDDLVEKAMETMPPVFSERLKLFIGVKREDWKTLILPKLYGGIMKPGYANACYGLRSSLRSLWSQLHPLQEEAKTWHETKQGVCPYCGEELSISIVVDKRSLQS
ncbi:hypothetical protein KKH23_10220 [Patescibacteria group bacterium]|nr:hypothetical protein [Patescibacteria group bacterium]